MDTLTIVIPGRNEEFMGKTVEDCLKNIRGNTDIIAVLDGYDKPIPDLPQDPRVYYIFNQKPEGQRKATNRAARLAKGYYIMKVDAHCSFDEGFDVKMMAKMQDNYTMVPVMRNLWAFDWKCYDCGFKTYQGPTPEKCSNCGSKNVKKKMMWVGKDNPQSTSYCFDSEPHFQYFKEYTERPEYKEMKEREGLTETMSLQGSCFMVTRDKYWELDLSSENWPSEAGWGSQGIEVACKTWLSGGRVVVNHDTWYAHMFRTQGGDFSFPYPGPNANPAKRYAKQVFINKDLVPLLEKFAPIPGWSQEDIEKLKKGQ